LIETYIKVKIMRVIYVTKLKAIGKERGDKNSPFKIIFLMLI
jgi:hypothetical protein